MRNVNVSINRNSLTCQNGLVEFSKKATPDDYLKITHVHRKNMSGIKIIIISSDS